jgi:hypothetical protein
VSTRPLTEEEYKEWLLQPGTQHLMEILDARREELRQAWEGGTFTDYSLEQTVLLNVANMGTCKGYAFVMDLQYELYLQELSDARE